MPLRDHLGERLYRASRPARAVVQEWFRCWRARADFPDDYDVLAVTTTGKQPMSDLILELSLLPVRARQPQVADTVILDWTVEPGLSAEELSWRLPNPTRQSRWGPIAKYPFHREILATTGRPPQEALPHFLDAVAAAQAAGRALVGHDGWRKDAAFLDGHAYRWLRRLFRVREERFLDTAMLDKASAYGLWPLREETPADFWERVYRQSPQGTCETLYSRAKDPFRLIPDVPDWSVTLRAGQVAQLTHVLLEEFRRLGEPG